MIKKLMNNRYNEVKKKLENKELIILDGATGSELENRGIEMDNTWCGTASLQTVSYTHLTLPTKRIV